MFGVGVPGNVGHHRRTTRSSPQHSGRARERDPEDRNERYVADFLLPFCYACHTLPRNSHGFDDRRLHRSEREIIRAYVGRSPRKLGFVMRCEAQFYSRAEDRTKVRGHAIDWPSWMKSQPASIGCRQYRLCRVLRRRTHHAPWRGAACLQYLRTRLTSLP